MNYLLQKAFYSTLNSDNTLCDDDKVLSKRGITAAESIKKTTRICIKDMGADMETVWDLLESCLNLDVKALQRTARLDHARVARALILADRGARRSLA